MNLYATRRQTSRIITVQEFTKATSFRPNNLYKSPPVTVGSRLSTRRHIRGDGADRLAREVIDGIGLELIGASGSAGVIGKDGDIVVSEGVEGND